MCGIVGYVGNANAQAILLDSLSRLEYRGYDSAGLALLDDQNLLEVTKHPGKLDNLTHALEKVPLEGKCGIGHTRWATHGKPTRANAHPHLSYDGRVALVHNGIIENDQALKAKYLKGIKLKGQTDSEVVANLVALRLQKYGDLYQALASVVKELQGAYALCAMSPDCPGEIIVARLGSPLILGIGKKQNFIASDVPAILPYTKSIIYLDEGDLARIRADKVEVYAASGKRRRVKAKQVKLSLEAAEKGGYPHFMLKEIHEQPEAIDHTLRGRIKRGRVELQELESFKTRFKRVKQIQIIACGTSYHAGVVGSYVLQEFTGLSTTPLIGSEYRYCSPVVDKHTLVIVISQSGETADTKSALNYAREQGALTLAICNVPQSSIPRIADASLYTRAGIEIGVASTKAYTTQLVALILFALWLGQERESMSQARIRKLTKELRALPEMITSILQSKLVGVKRCAARYQNVNNFMYIGRRYNYATAFEGALKLKEISYIHAEGYGAGEMKHGPIALVEGTFPTIVICPKSLVYEKTLVNIKEIRARGGVIVAIASQGDEEIKKVADYLIYIPVCSEVLSPILAIVPLQLLAYYTAVKRDKDPDKPRNLAKSVTVE